MHYIGEGKNSLTYTHHELQKIIKQKLCDAIHTTHTNVKQKSILNVLTHSEQWQKNDLNETTANKMSKCIEHQSASAPIRNILG